MNLNNEIAGWDKKSADVIVAIYNRYNCEPRFVEEIVKLTTNETLQTGSTWLLKHYLEHNKEPVAEHLIETIYQDLDNLVDWEAKLHVLQCIKYLPVPKICIERTEQFVLNNINSEIKFVRAWAYDGYYQLAKQYPALRSKVEPLLVDALENEPAASVKARIRNINMMGF